MKRPILYILIFIFSLSMLVLRPAHAEQASYSDAHVKAAYLIKLRYFITWPDSIEPNHICVVGSDLIGSALAQIQNSSESLKKLKISRKTHTSSFDDCDLVFISDADEENMGAVQYSLQDFPVLTVSDIKSFIDRGGMIGLVSKDQKIKLEMNIKAIRRAGLSASSRLLGIAYRIIDNKMGP